MCCSSLRSTFGAKAIMILHPIEKKLSVVYSVPTNATTKKFKLPRLSAMIQSNAKPLPVKV